MIDGSPSAVNKTAQICVSIIAGVAMTLLAVLLTQMLWQVLSVLAIVVSPLALFYVGANLNRRVSFVKQRTEYWVRASAAMFFLAAVLSETNVWQPQEGFVGSSIRRSGFLCV